METELYRLKFETVRTKLDLNPDDGAGLERNVKEIFTLEAALAAKLKQILK